MWLRSAPNCYTNSTSQHYHCFLCSLLSVLCRTHLGFLLFLLIDIFLIASGIGVVWCIVGIYYISIRRLIRIMNQSRMEKKRTHHVEQSSATQSISELKEATLSSNLGHEVQRSEGTIKKRNKKWETHQQPSWFFTIQLNIPIVGYSSWYFISSWCSLHVFLQTHLCDFREHNVHPSKKTLWQQSTR